MNTRFEQLVDQHGHRLLQVARLMLQRADEAEDVVQDSLIKLWNHLPKLRIGDELPWLITCTRNACLDRLRARTRTRTLLRLVAGQQQALAPDAEPGPDLRMLSEQRSRLIREAIAGLAEPGRSLLILRDIQELDVATVARALDLSENQVKVYTFRARRSLRRHLEEENAHEQVA
ncbi:MAG: RNA polymerase sigma factor [Wenzhouxiangellaceae bacterium]|nr:RNA polymerase sigma factor [Wenzhouxiangellaceae bacterium]